MAPTIGLVAGDECPGGLFVEEKGWMVCWVMERKPGKQDHVRVRVRVREAGGIENGESAAIVKYFTNF